MKCIPPAAVGLTTERASGHFPSGQKRLLGSPQWHTADRAVRSQSSTEMLFATSPITNIAAVKITGYRPRKEAAHRLKSKEVGSSLSPVLFIFLTDLYFFLPIPGLTS